MSKSDQKLNYRLKPCSKQLRHSIRYTTSSRLQSIVEITIAAVIVTIALITGWIIVGGAWW